MSLNALVTGAVETALSAAGDLVVGVTWRRQTLGAYNPANGQRAVTNVDVAVRAIEDKITAGEQARLELSARAVKLWIPAADFTGADPSHSDKLIHRGTTYTIKSATFQGTKALWEIHADI